MAKASPFSRPYTRFEERVLFKELNKTFDVYEEAFVREVGPVQRKQVETLLADIEKILKEDRQEDLVKVRVKFHEAHVRAIRSILKKAAEDTVVLTEKEFESDKRVTVPRALRTQNAIRAEVQASTFEQRIKIMALSTVLRGLRTGLTTSEIMFQLRTSTKNG